MKKNHFFNQEDLVKLTLSDEKMSKILGGNIDIIDEEDPSYVKSIKNPPYLKTYSESTYVKRNIPYLKAK